MRSSYLRNFDEKSTNFLIVTLVGLFHKAIIQGGVSSNPWANIPVNPSKYAYQLAAKLGEKSTDPQTVLDFLRRVDPKSLVLTAVTLIPPEVREIKHLTAM